MMDLKLYKCIKCNKMYKHKQSLYNHKNRGCKGLPEEFIMSVDIIDDDIDKYCLLYTSDAADE